MIHFILFALFIFKFILSWSHTLDPAPAHKKALNLGLKILSNHSYLAVLLKKKWNFVFVTHFIIPQHKNGLGAESYNS